MPKRPHDRANKGKTIKLGGKKEKKKSRFNFSGGFKINRKKKEKGAPRKVELDAVSDDVVAWQIALLSPFPGESEQLLIMQKSPDGKKIKPIHFDEKDSGVFVETDEDDVFEIYSKSRPLSLIDIQTHTQWTPPSLADITIFLEFDSISESYLVTPKTADDGDNLVYALKKRKLSRAVKEFDKDKFEKEWEETLKEAETIIDKRKSDNLDWFNRESLNIGSANDKEFAIKLKRIEMLGKRYGFEVSVFSKDGFLIADKIDQSVTAHRSEDYLNSIWGEN